MGITKFTFPSSITSLPEAGAVIGVKLERNKWKCYVRPERGKRTYLMVGIEPVTSQSGRHHYQSAKEMPLTEMAKVTGLSFFPFLKWP